MATSYTISSPTTSKNGPSPDLTHNPFDTPFDGSEDEWWNEEDSPSSSSVEPSPNLQKTQWAKRPESTAIISKPVNRASGRRTDNRYSVRKPTRDKSKGRQRRKNAEAGIKVVTIFSKPQVRSKLESAKASRNVGCFVDLATLQALGDEPVHVSRLLWKSKKNKEMTRDAMARSAERQLPGASSRPAIPTTLVAPETQDHQSLTPQSISDEDLSPNDRPIVIGISIPSRKAAEHTVSPQTATSEASKIVRSYEHRTPTTYTPDTPSIIITPAQGGSEWTSLESSNASPSRWRTSSVYSQRRSNYDNWHMHNSPPVPNIPASILEGIREGFDVQKSYFSPDSDDATMWDEERDNNSPLKSRTASSCTGLEKDVSPVNARISHSLPVLPDGQVTKHASFGALAVRRRSKGWWNYITTPFLTRSNTAATREVQDEQSPVLPSLAIAAAIVLEAKRSNTTWENDISPLTPETTASMESEPHWQGELNEAKSAEQPPALHEARHKLQPSTATLPFVLAQVGGIDSTTTPEGTSGSESRFVSGRSTSEIAINALELPRNKAVPDLVDITNASGVSNTNPYTQPRLVDLNSTNIQSATTQIIYPVRATVVQASAPSTHAQTDAPPPPYSPSPSRIRKYAVISPPEQPVRLQHSISPGPLSPGMQQAVSSGNAIPMSQVILTNGPRRYINLNSEYPELPARPAGTHLRDKILDWPLTKSQDAESKRRRYEREDKIARRAGGWWRGRGCIPKRGCYGRTGAEGRKRRRWYLGLIVGFLSLMILIIILATTLPRTSKVVVGPSQWLNLTGFPPIFEGLSTVVAPLNIVTNTGCVFPATQWSCDLPKELQASVAPNQPNQPNFVLNIQWDNSSAANATFANVTTDTNLRSRNLVGNPVSARKFIKRLILDARDIVTFIPLPAPPSFAEGFFLGNTTDGIISSNKAGEPTPFYISFLDAANTSLTKRQVVGRQDSTSTDPFPDVTGIIPAPDLNSGGTAAPANLLPLPSQQPIRLFDRGLPSEHYGFYTYFDRSIFLKSITLLNGTNAADGEVPDDGNGGATDSEASFRCTWAQTRFLVQMWTRMDSVELLNSTSTTTSPKSAEALQPGTFPYPITITTDRHGGDSSLKMIYCYSMDNREGIVAISGQINAENRGFGGTLINPAPGLFTNTSDPSVGGFDGGTGGCKCQWSNFQNAIDTST